MKSEASSADASFMRLAIDASSRAAAAGNMPFGAVLVQDGAVVQVSVNQQRSAGGGRGDTTAHAEIVLVREAEATHGKGVLAGGTVYASGEPCAMCSGALFWAGVRRIVYAASTPDIIAALGGPQLPLRCHQVLAGADPAPVVEGPLLRDAALEVLEAARRKLSGG
jgi:tRNA(Arg) A34 adenosine deaminase TadA